MPMGSWGASGRVWPTGGGSSSDATFGVLCSILVLVPERQGTTEEGLVEAKK